MEGIICVGRDVRHWEYFDGILVDWRDPTRTEDWNKSWNMTSNIISCAQE
jgi:hypothetical protein